MVSSLFFLSASLIISALPLSAYMVDTFKLYSASALTGLIIARYIIYTVMPIINKILIEKFGYRYRSSILAFLNMLLALIPFAVFKYGSKWRQ